MSRFHISHRAANDEAEIWLHIANQSPDAADRLMAALEKSYQTLADFPGLGQACDELSVGSRCIPVGRYVVYYRPTDHGIEVLRVVHGARDVRNLSDSSEPAGEE